MTTTTPEVLCLGELLIDFISAKSGVPLRHAPGFHKAAGGAPANVAVGLARLGHLAAFIGKVGKDEFGLGLEETLRENGVDTRALRFDSRVPTTLAFVALSDEGVPEFIFYRHPGADTRLRPEEIDPNIFTGARVFHFGSLSLTNQPARRATWYALQLARSRALIRTFDANVRLSLWSSRSVAQRLIRRALEQVDVAKVSLEELAFLFGTDDLELGTARMARHVRLTVVTLGPRGCFYRLGPTTGYVPGFQVEVADTTGAGDGFMAGLISGLLTHVSSPVDLTTLRPEVVEPILTFANAVGALVTTRPGAIPSLPTREEVETWLATNPPRRW